MSNFVTPARSLLDLIWLVEADLLVESYAMTQTKMSNQRSQSSKPVKMLVLECRMLCKLQLKLAKDNI